MIFLLKMPGGLKIICLRAVKSNEKFFFTFGMVQESFRNLVEIFISLPSNFWACLETERFVSFQGYPGGRD